MLTQHLFNCFDVQGEPNLKHQLSSKEQKIQWEAFGKLDIAFSLKAFEKQLFEHRSLKQFMTFLESTGYNRCLFLIVQLSGSQLGSSFFFQFTVKLIWLF